MEKEYDLCIRDIKTPIGSTIMLVISVLALLFTPLGIVGLSSDWGPPQIYITLLAFGIASCIMMSVTIMYIMVMYILKEEAEPPPRRHSNPLRGVNAV
jgi:hypothetical protein